LLVSLLFGFTEVVFRAKKKKRGRISIEIFCLFHSLLHILSCCISFGGRQGACDAYIIRDLGK
jgi:hypothetical protein